MSNKRPNNLPTSTMGRRLRRRRSDRGFTLPELLITMTLMGLLATVLSAAISVTLRTVSSTEGRANVARAESAIDTWLPADLASTDVNADPAITGYLAANTAVDATPCAGGGCGSIDFSGANALLLTWETPDGITQVQYYYVKRGDEWVMERIECLPGQQCTRTTVLHDLEPPADEAAFLANPTTPVWVMDVAVPDPTTTPGLTLNDNARQILVTIDGGGDADGAGGGSNNVQLTAGGRTSEEIAPDEFKVPSFTRSKSRCGGPVTLIIDSSGSVGNSTLNGIVKPGVVDFINAFKGTETQLQIVDFDTTARVLGASGSEWHKYYDMTNDSEVNALISQVNSGSLSAGGGTNWEDAFYRAFKERNGNSAGILPGRVVFFTDGQPTFHRNSSYSGNITRSGDARNYNAGPYVSPWAAANGFEFTQEGWDRTDVLLEPYRAAGTDLIFVGVGTGLDNTHDWIQNKAVYNDLTADPSPAITRKGEEIVAQLVKGVYGGHTLATTDGAGDYNNTEVANFYRLNDYAAFGDAMRATALKGCGGTLNIQTRDTNGVSVDAEFVYENTAYYDAAGNQVVADARRSTTSGLFKTGGFDFEIAGTSNFFDVDIVPAELQTIDGYDFVDWDCAAGIVDKPTTAIDIVDSDFEGFQVEVRPNEAVSCIMTVKVSP